MTDQEQAELPSEGQEKADELMDRAIDHLKAERADEALEVARELHSMRYSGAFEIEAQALAQQGKKLDAIAVLRKGLALAPNAWLNGNLLGNYLSDVEQYEDAFSVYEETLRTPSADRALIEGNYALALSRAGRGDEARSRLRSISDEDLEAAGPGLRDFIEGLASDWGLRDGTTEPVPWSARLHVRPLPGETGGLEGGAAGAYAWVFALAKGEAEYREMVAAEMEALGLFIAEVDRLAPYEPHPDDDENLTYCAERLSAEWPVQYHDFHTYPHDEA